MPVKHKQFGLQLYLYFMVCMVYNANAAAAKKIKDASHCLTQRILFQFLTDRFISVELSYNEDW